MAIDSFPNTPHNTRAITLAENEQLLAPLGGSGMVGYTGVTPVYGDSTGRQVKVRAGVHGWIRGTKFTNTAETTVALTTNTSGNPRVDLLVARLTRSTYVVSYVVIAGTAAVTPLAPAPVRNDTIDGSGVYDLPLAEITVADSYTTVAPANVKNRAWWLATSGYQGFSTAQPPVDPGALFTAHDVGINYVGTAAGVWKKIYFNNGQVSPGLPAGWSSLAFSFTRLGDMIIMNARLLRTGAGISPSTNVQMTTLSGGGYLPPQAWFGAYHCTSPLRSGKCAIGTDGSVTFAGTGVSGQGIDTGAELVCNMSWPVSEP